MSFEKLQEDRNERGLGSLCVGGRGEIDQTGQGLIASETKKLFEIEGAT
jgi:hypothetical protein